MTAHSGQGEDDNTSTVRAIEIALDVGSLGNVVVVMLPRSTDTMWSSKDLVLNRQQPKEETPRISAMTRTCGFQVKRLKVEDLIQTYYPVLHHVPSGTPFSCCELWSYSHAK